MRHCGELERCRTALTTIGVTLDLLARFDLFMLISSSEKKWAIPLGIVFTDNLHLLSTTPAEVRGRRYARIIGHSGKRGIVPHVNYALLIRHGLGDNDPI